LRLKKRTKWEDDRSLLIPNEIWAKKIEIPAGN
jgi:hypothetical protein